MEDGDDMPQGQHLHSASTGDAYLISIITLYNYRCSHYLYFAGMRYCLDMQTR